MRVVAYVDGFNLYHSVAALKAPHLKWLDVRGVCLEFAPSAAALCGVYYYSAFATWLPGAHARHREYVKALEARGVVCRMAQFYPKRMKCPTSQGGCGRKWRGHEEKQTDVALGVALVMGAVHNAYDRALLVTGDSDFVPAVELVRTEYPTKRIVVLNPPGRDPSYHLVTAAGQTASKAIERLHIERNLLPAVVEDASGLVVARRPSEYDPPCGSATS